MTEATRRAAKPEPSHAAIISVIEAKFGEVFRRLDHGETRFDRIERKMDDADEARSAMQVDIASLKQATAAAHERPWWLGWKPLAALAAMAVFAGAGLATIAIAGLDIVPKLQAITAAAAE